MVEPRAAREPIGRGLAWPIDVDPTGRVRWSVPLDDVTEDSARAAMAGRLKHLILTIAGQRCLRRGWGTDVAGHLFLPAMRAVVASILREAVEAVRREMPGVGIVSALVEVEQATGTVTFLFGWRMVASGLVGEAKVEVGLSGGGAALG